MAPVVKLDILALLPSLERYELEILAGETGYQVSDDDTDADLRSVILANKDAISIE